MRLTAAARSGAVSASVPSKSNSTALVIAKAAQEVVHVAVAPQRVSLRYRVVCHADELVGSQPGVAAPARKLRRLDEALVVVGAFRQEAKDVLRPDDGEQVGLRISVDGREEQLPAGAHEPRARAHHAGRIGNVLE